MASSQEIPVGERVRFYRGSRSQAAVAGLVGITTEYLSLIERSLRTPTIATLHRLAGVLGVSTSVLLGEPVFEPETVGHPAIPALRRALAGLEPPGGEDQVADLDALQERVTRAWAAWQSSPTRYTDVGRLLPDLVLDIERAGHSSRRGGPPEYRAVMRTTSDLYGLVRAFTKQVGRVDLAGIAVDRGVRAAEAADDPLRMAAASWNLGHTLLSENRPEDAEEVALRSAEGLEPRTASDVEAAGLYGSLYLLAVLAAARRRDPWTARRLLRERAVPVAQMTGDGNLFLGTAFGPTNVGLHAVTVEMEAGEAAEGIRLGDDVDPTRLATVERRSTFYLELARCYDIRQEDTGVLLHLQRAEQEAPEDIRFRVLSRDMVRGLLRRARPSYLPEVRALAARMSLYD